MSTPKKITASIAVLASAGAFVSFGAFSAFTDTASNTSSLGTANIALTSVPSSGSTLVTLTDLIPGDVLTRCIAVTNTSSIDAKVVLSAVTAGTNPTMLDSLLASVQDGTVATNQTPDANCTGFTAGSFVMGSGALTLTGNYSGAKNAGNLANETYSSWATGTTARKYFQVKIAVPLDIAGTAAGKSATLQLKFDASPARSANTAR